jgi:hypothetical protein
MADPLQHRHWQKYIWYTVRTFGDFCPLPSSDHWAIQDNDYCTVHTNCHRTKQFKSLIYLKNKMTDPLLFSIQKKPATFMRSTHTQEFYKRYNTWTKIKVYENHLSKITRGSYNYTRRTARRLKYVIRTRDHLAKYRLRIYVTFIGC